MLPLGSVDAARSARFSESRISRSNSTSSGVRRLRGAGFAQAVVGLQEQEDHEGDQQEVDQRLEHQAVPEGDFAA